ncbi:uncharacterized protein B0H18DRAFT_1217107 [Fomitopsis serialis]|uniref:uncharacterized protein n=1 Tax=Fomitopsis serialis TaxID=139415 RepID=UPI0020077DBB|nr:uncharacterized protein B0H18DRAFT_1217107 [Neoantrodia serialis]KAH9912366.1 hypothetical protein B0H18DRAFT_1217107 [Neoantrodia serialis]
MDIDTQDEAVGLALFDTTPESFATLLRMPILSRPFILSFTPAHTRPPAPSPPARALPSPVSPTGTHLSDAPPRSRPLPVLDR